MSLFSELRRRNVFRVGIAYLITAWLLVQVADILLETFSAPEWTMKFIVVVLLVGFPLALFFAWAFELTPDGVKREKEVDRSQSIAGQTGHKLDRAIIGVLVVALAWFAWDKFGNAPAPVADSTETAAQAVPAGETAEPAKEENSIAVLPFTDMSAEGDQAYFGDGIAEEILNVLVKTRKLKVAGRTSSFQFRDHNEDLRTIGEQLGVNHILEGSIRKANNRVRITAQLIEADTGFHLWSETYDRNLDDIFAVQDEIARAITDALAVQLDIADDNQALAPVQTTNMVAYENYLEARALVSQRTEFLRAIQLLEEATTLDDNFAEAWAMLAQAHALSFYYGAEEKGEAVRTAETNAERALQLDPGSAVAWSALGDAVRDQTRWNDAWDAYSRALELNPENVETHSQFGQMLMRLGHLNEALTHTRRAAEIDPLSWVYQGIYGANLWLLGQKDAAWTAMRKSDAVAKKPRSVMSRIQLRMALEEGNRALADQIIQAFADHPDTTDPTDTIHFLELGPMLDQPERAREYLRSFDITPQKDMDIEMFWTVYFDDMELAREWLEQLLSVEPNDVIVDPIWLQFETLAPLRNLDEFRQLQQLYRHDDFWREHGWPAYCWPTSPVDFECGKEKPQ
jgi:TolB-like protein/tetratricopeptide (TPR) repeat protein